MDETATITLGYSVAKPVETQEDCDRYSAMAKAVNEHNWACAVGDMTWSIEDKPDRYEVVEGGALPEPTPAPPSLEDKIAELQAAQTDTDSLMVDQEYRLTLLELGITE